jgi:hypothetical protein
MNIFTLEYIRSLHPAIWAGFFLPLLFALFLWVRFYALYDAAGLKSLSEALRSVIRKGSLARDCSRENMELLEGGITSRAPAAFRAAWRRLRRDMEHQYRGDFIPEAEAYFDLESLILIPGGRKSIASQWGCFGILAIISFISPALAYIFAGKILSQTAVILGILSLLILCVGQAVFALADQKAYQQALADYDEFTELFNSVLPVAGALTGAALLMEATGRNQAAFKASADKIAARFDTFSSEVVLPALRESTTLLIQGNLVPAVERIESSLKSAMEAFSSRQEDEVKTFTEAFADKLSGTLELRLNTLGEMLGTVEAGLSGLNKQLEQNLAGMDAVVTEQKVTLQQASDLLAKVGEAQLAGNQNQELFNSRVATLGETVTLMEAMLDKFTMQTGQLWQEASQVQKDQAEELLRSRQLMIQEFQESLSGMSRVFGTAQENLSANVQDLQEQYTGLNRLITDMMLNITDRMNDAMAHAGREIGKGIQGATADNAQAITELTEQAARLREDYDTYFGRLEDSTKQTLDDMDFHVQNITVKMTEDISVMLKDILEQNTQVLEQYKENTTNLLQSFDEQARSISLYAKEMNYDITELSASMKDSVAVFTKQIQEGVTLSIGQFDSGLAELSVRIANTVENIADAVENIPAAIFGNK